MANNIMNRDTQHGVIVFYHINRHGLGITSTQSVTFLHNIPCIITNVMLCVDAISGRYPLI